MSSSIERAVQLAGGQSALARAVLVSPQAVQQWVDAGRVSYKKVLAVEKATGVPRYELRPDIYCADAPPQDTQEVRDAA
jgi:DNA-binding transcriptional regulator YdaS (Cro superfamily)